jgi:outer membrane receptor protein involved in Fe transport
MVRGLTNPQFFGIVVVLVFLPLLCPSEAWAQATGQITGLISDATGAVVPDAAIEVVNEATGQVRSVTSRGDGFYLVPLVNPGMYQIKATKTGFSTLTRNAIEVAVSGTTRVDITLQVGQVAEQVTASAVAPLVETRNATLGVVVDERKVVDLPLNGRNFAQLGTLLPGVVAPPASLGGLDGNATVGGFGIPTGSFNVNGMRNQSNNFQLDGAANNDSFNSGFVVRPPPDAVQEFKILTHSYGAEYGRNAGSVVNVVTKSGTNRWHGSAWEFNRDDNFQARNFFATFTPTLKQNQFGGALGGPIVKNRLFIFGYYEGFRNTQGTTSNLVVLSAAQRAGNFGGTAIRDPLTGQAFQGNTIPGDRISPISTKILNDFIPLPNQPGNHLVRAPNTEDRRHQFGDRVDYRVNDSHTLFGRYLYGHSNAFNPLGGSNFSPKGNTAVARVQDVMGSDTWTIRPNMINVARGGVNRIDAKPTLTSGLNLSSLGFQYNPSNPAAAGLPFLTLLGFFTAGDAQQPFANRVNNAVSFSDDFSWIVGRHSLKFGGEIRRDQINVVYINRPNGDFTFTGQYSGNAAADFLLGFPIQFRQATGDPKLDGSSWTYSAYGQDEFRLNSRITLTYGLRYEINQPFVEAHDHLAAFHPGQQSVKFPDAPTGLVYPGDGGLPRGTYHTDRNNFAPRVALVWDPRGDGRTSIRTAWGIFYDTIPGQGDFFQNGTLAPPFQPLTEVNFPLQVSGPRFANPLQGVGGTSKFPAGLIFIGWGPDFTTPLVQQYNFTVQRQIGGAFALEAGYVGSYGDHLPIFIEVNPTAPILAPQPAIGPRPFPAFSLLRPTFSVANSWYNAFQSSVRMRQSHGLNLLASYTYSHALDDVSGLNIGGEQRPMLPVTIGDSGSFDRALTREKGSALFDVRHRFVLSFGYELPFFRNANLATRLLLGGWQLNGIVQAQTGFPLTVIEPNNVSLTSLTNRPNLVCDPNQGAPRSPTRYFNTSCFQRLTLPSNAGQIGNEGRNVVKGPGFNQTDLSVFKNFAITESHQVQLRFEAFNALNQARFNQPGGTAGTPTFGAITTAADGRVLQMAAKYTF